MTDGDTTKQDDEGRNFERWALVGVAVVIVVAVVVVLLRADRASNEESPVKDPSAIVDVRIGGGAAPDLSPARAGRLPPLDDPWPPPQGDSPPPQPDPPRSDAPESELPGPDPVVAPSATRSYVVQKGETLSQIAKRELGSVSRMREIVELNRIANPNAIRAGDELRLPPR